jgi:hypothetical protein
MIPGTKEPFERRRRTDWLFFLLVALALLLTTMVAKEYL